MVPRLSYPALSQSAAAAASWSAPMWPPPASWPRWGRPPPGRCCWRDEGRTHTARERKRRRRKREDNMSLWSLCYQDVVSTVWAEKQNHVKYMMTKKWQVSNKLCTLKSFSLNGLSQFVSTRGNWWGNMLLHGHNVLKWDCCCCSTDRWINQ